MFNSTITPTVLYGCACWTTTKLLTTKLQCAQRRMLRLMIGTTRRKTINTNNDITTTATTVHDQTPDLPDTLHQSTTLEPWPDYIKRATRIAEHRLAAQHIEAWTTTLLRRKWRWASRVAAQPHNRWTRLVIAWQPQLDHTRCATRRQARPHTRWHDDLQHFLQAQRLDAHNNWLQIAKDSTTWLELEDKYVE